MKKPKYKPDIQVPIFDPPKPKTKVEGIGYWELYKKSRQNEIKLAVKLTKLERVIKEFLIDLGVVK